MENSSMSIHTDFAPAERSSEKKIQEQSTMFGKAEVLSKLLNVTSTMVAILNNERQIVYANKLFFQKLGAANLDTLIGNRPGEAVFCIHAIEAPGGCGTTKYCTVCGAVNAILEAQHGTVSVKECRITTQNNGALDLKVTATPYEWENDRYTIFAIEDISHEKRKQALEQVFFHDILNAAGGISGLTSVLEITEDPHEMAEIAKIINRGTNHLIEEIKSQRLLTAAENGALVLNCKKINSHEILQDVVTIYANHEVCSNKFIHIQPDAEEVKFKSDHTLVRRILGNMLKNALEATMPGDTVTLDCKRKDEKIAFSVHNKVVIPSEIQLQLFNRSFSTKGLGRGIGTYSMKLFGEKYLKGEVDFLSTKKEGTTFFLRLPVENPDCGTTK